MEWREYLKNVLNDASVLDDLQMTVTGEPEPSCVPPIIKASIQLLNRIVLNQGKYNIIVFPERSQLVFLFTLMKAIYNIAVGEIGKAYDPKSFVKGEKLKFKNCVVAFNCIDITNDTPYLWFDTADCKVGAPIEIVPLLQRTNTNRPLSKYQEFAKAKKEEAIEQELLMKPSERLLATLADYRTHISCSVFWVSSIKNAQDQMKECLLNGQHLSDLMLLGHVNPDGAVRNLSAGQLAGNPAIVLAADLYSIINAKNNGASIQSIIVDISNPNIISAQLNAIDDLMRTDTPMTFVTDTVNSFDLELLTDRGFNLWRWDEDSITEELYGKTSYLSDMKIDHCANRKIEYLNIGSIEISDSLKRLNAHRIEVKEQSPGINDLFGKLFNLTFSALRNLVPLTVVFREQMLSVLSECERSLSEERAFISPETYSDYSQIICNLKRVFGVSFSFGKIKALEEQLVDSLFLNICIVVPERTDKISCQNYWQDICISHSPLKNVFVMYPSEYYLASNLRFDTTIVAGWLNANIMRRILYSYNSGTYVVLLYDYERYWKDSHTKTWNRILSNESTKGLIRKSLSASVEIPVTQLKTSALSGVVPEPDELEEIELTLRENKYRQYVAQGGQLSADEVVEAIPVNFVGEYLAFFKTSHKIITATNIIVNDGEQIETILPIDLKVGDFVVVREADRDIIKDIAKVILDNSDKSSCLELAGKWKQSLEVESLFTSVEGIYQKLKTAGCSKDFPVVRRWMTDEDVIAPLHKEDLICIAKATDDQVLTEMADQVYEAARTVRTAHTQAGKYLSSRLKSTIASELLSFGGIDPFNIWDPVSLNLENIGLVRILKVIDIGDSVLVDARNTNHLIEEM